MRTPIVAAAIAFIVGFILTPLIRDLALRRGLVDEPVGGRKVHLKPVPRVGGLAAVPAFAASVLLVLAYSNSVSESIARQSPLLLALALGGGVIVLTGVVDDIWGIRVRYKLLGQIVAALTVWGCGVSIHILRLPLLGAFELGWLELPVTLLWIVLITNAFNFVDGLDGLAGGVVAMATGSLFVLSVFVSRDPVSATLTAALLGATLAFLRYNVPPATVFLGDTGSMAMGFVIALVTMYTSQKSYALFSVMAALLVVGLPVFDLIMAVVRRFLAGRPIYEADQHHLHHQLLRMGLTKGWASLALIGVAALLEIVAFALIFTGDAVTAITAVLLVPLAAIAVKVLGYDRVIRSGWQGRFMEEIHEAAWARNEIVDAFRRDIAALGDEGLLWTRLTGAATALGLEGLTLVTREGERRWDRSAPAQERDIHLDGIHKVRWELDLAGYQGALEASWFLTEGVLPPHDEALARMLADAVALRLGAMGRGEGGTMEEATGP